MKVYVVKHDEGCGEYTTHEVTDAIFSTQENAYHYVKQQGSGGYWEVEEYELDQCMKGLPPINPDLEVGPVYSVSIREVDNDYFNHRYDRITLRHPDECEIHGDVVSSPKGRMHARDRARELLIERITDHIKAQDQLLADIRRLFPECEVVLNFEPGRSLTSAWQVIVERAPKVNVEIEWAGTTYKHYRVKLGTLQMTHEDPASIITSLKNLV